MGADIVLSAGIRQNLLSLQNTSSLQEMTQERLATGKKVNSALDNAVNFFTSSALSQRARELSNLLDSMTNGVNTLKVASSGLSSITTTIQSMQATVTQARQDASWQSSSYTIDATAIGTTATKAITFTGGAVGTPAISVYLNDYEVASAVTAYATSNVVTGNLTIHSADINGGVAITISITAGETASSVIDKINTAAGATIASNTANLTIQASGPNAITLTESNAGVIDGLGFNDSATPGTFTSVATAGAVETVDQVAALINANVNLQGRVKASNNAGQLQITNLSTIPMTVTGINVTTGRVDGGNGINNIAGNLVRSNLVTQFNQLKDQLDKTAQDASFNGINLLVGDVLKLFFNELSTSTLSIQSTNPNGVNSNVLGLASATNAEFQDNTALDSRLQALQAALAKVSSQASDFGSNLSIVQNRQEFTNNMINTLKQGADGLTLADTNEEGANMLALQTRQQLSITALSLASQANQSVLKLFG